MEQELIDQVRTQMRQNVAACGVSSIAHIDMVTLWKRRIIPRGAWTAFLGARYSDPTRWLFYPIYRKAGADGGPLYSLNHLMRDDGCLKTLCGRSLYNRLDLSVDLRGPGEDCKACMAVARANCLYIPPVLDSGFTAQPVPIEDVVTVEEVGMEAKSGRVLDAITNGDITFNEAARALAQGTVKRIRAREE